MSCLIYPNLAAKLALLPRGVALSKCLFDAAPEAEDLVAAVEERDTVERAQTVASVLEEHRFYVEPFYGPYRLGGTVRVTIAHGDHPPLATAEIPLLRAEADDFRNLDITLAAALSDCHQEEPREYDGWYEDRYDLGDVDFGE